MAESTSARRRVGAGGEERAAEWYRSRGYRVLARNWRCRDGELDLVVARGGVLVFCEVKARTTAAFGAPVEAVTVRKQLQVRRLAARWLAAGLAPAAYRDIRFDVASVLAGTIDVVEGAF